MRFLGSKETLTNSIRTLLHNHNILQRNLVFFDAFCGMGSVADSMKAIYNHIIINDSLKCSTVFTRGKLYANICTFERLGFNPFTFLNGNNNTLHGFFYQNYSQGGSERMYFTEENAGRIDYFRKQIEEWKVQDRITEEEYVYLLACLLESVSDVSNTAGVYGAFLKHWDKRALKPIIFSAIDSNEGICEIIESQNDRIEDIISDIECDILYLDPPYTQNQYGTQYHLLETLILNDNPPISKVTGSRPTTPMRSNWSKMYHAHILFEKVVAETKASHIILSYNNDGFMSKDFIEKTLKRFGVEETYDCVTIDYKKYNNTKCKGADGHQEYIFYIQKKPSSEVIIESPLNYTGSKTKMVPIIKNYLPHEQIHTFIDAFGGGFNVGINIPAELTIYNDINPFVKGLIQSFRTDTYSYLSYVNNLIQKYSLSPNSREGYAALRDYYNSRPIPRRDPRMLYTLILYGFQQQIRFNTDHGFNNPIGSRWFNECLLSKFISFARCSKSKNIEYLNVSFERLTNHINPDTFVYADPPYRSTLGVYNDGKRGFEGWTIEHEQRLCLFLDWINQHEAKFMLSYVLQVEDFYNEDVANWATRNNYRIIDVDAPQGRYNDRREVLIVNY
ncbi:MAG: DNA adenine methylase [Bacteroidaceae bacterium]|nr:DNA adenine methylase [Bacteroidaceae bacterium]